jgi:hypothetical protein
MSIEENVPGEAAFDPQAETLPAADDPQRFLTVGESTDDGQTRARLENFPAHSSGAKESHFAETIIRRRFLFVKYLASDHPRGSYPIARRRA